MKKESSVKSQVKRPKSQTLRVKSSESRAQSQYPRAEIQESRVESQAIRIMILKIKIKEPRVNIVGSSFKSQKNNLVKIKMKAKFVICDFTTQNGVLQCFMGHEESTLRFATSPGAITGFLGTPRAILCEWIYWSFSTDKSVSRIGC